MTDDVLLYETVKQQLESWSEAAFPFETGGILLGILGEGQPWIVDAAQLPSGAPARYAYQLPAGATHPAVWRAQEGNPMLGYLGDWHSHPLDARASPTDLATYVGVFQRALRLHEQPPLMIVMRRASDGWQTDVMAHKARFRRATPVSFVLTGPPPPPAPANVAHVFDTIRDMTDDELLDARRELHDATPPGWFVGRPSYDERRDEWSLYAFDTTERLKVGRRSREWTTVAPTQARVVREMTRCLRELSAGPVPR